MLGVLCRCLDELPFDILEVFEEFVTGGSEVG